MILNAIIKLDMNSYSDGKNDWFMFPLHLTLFLSVIGLTILSIFELISHSSLLN